MEAHLAPGLEPRSEPTLEGALAATESDAAAALGAAGTLQRELKKLKTAAADGVLGDLQKRLAAVEQLTSDLGRAVETLRAGWTLDDRAYLESGEFTTELLGTAKGLGVRLFEQDERILSYPSLVRVLPGDAAVEIDRKREKRIRPSVLAEILRARQQKPSSFRPQVFMEALLRAYRLALPEKPGRAMGATVTLLEVYQILTIFPGQAKDYSKQEFARDIYLLDQSDVRTRDGLQVSFPTATGTRSSGTLSTVTREGELKVYYGIAFRP